MRIDQIPERELRAYAEKNRLSKRASYCFAVLWIALNDNAGNGDDAEEVAGYISTALVADLFGTDVHRVARDIMRKRAEANQ